jgi:hypothetical protein
MKKNAIEIIPQRCCEENNVMSGEFSCHVFSAGQEQNMKTFVFRG